MEKQCRASIRSSDTRPLAKEGAGLFTPPMPCDRSSIGFIKIGCSCGGQYRRIRELSGRGVGCVFHHCFLSQMQRHIPNGGRSFGQTCVWPGFRNRSRPRRNSVVSRLIARILFSIGSPGSSHSGTAVNPFLVVVQLFSRAFISATQRIASEVKVLRADPDRLASAWRIPKRRQGESGLKRPVSSPANDLTLGLRVAISRRWPAGRRRGGGHRSRAGGEA